MTTVAATTTIMAADSRVTIADTSYLSPKLLLCSDAILGAAGDAEACHLFFEWWQAGRKAPLKIPRKQELSGLALTRTGLYRFEELGKPEYIRDGIAAVGTGEAIAIASMDTMLHLGLVPDPRVAVEMACKRSPGSAPPIDSFSVDQLTEDVVLIPKRVRKKNG